MPWYTSSAFAITMFFLPPLVSLVLLYLLKRERIWLSVPITLAADLLVWGPAVLHGGSHGTLAWVFLLPQLLIVALLSLLALRAGKKSGK